MAWRATIGRAAGAMRSLSPRAYSARLRELVAGGLLALASSAALAASSTVLLPVRACQDAQTIWADSYENDGVMPSDPSGGSGGALGDVEASVAVFGYSDSIYYLHVPADFSASRSWPVLLALHGAAGSHDNAVLAAQQARSDWAALADNYHFIVVAPVGVGSLGSWIPSASLYDHPSDYDTFAAAIAAVESSYNVERSRRYGWGFSAGGHVMHDLMLRGFEPALDANHVAAYGVNAGLLSQLTCANLTSSQCGQILAAAPRKLPLDIHVGTQDPLRPYAAADHNLFVAQGWSDGDAVYYRVFSGVHTYSPVQLGEIWQRICHYAVVP